MQIKKRMYRYVIRINCYSSQSTKRRTSNSKFINAQNNFKRNDKNIYYFHFSECRNINKIKFYIETKSNYLLKTIRTIPESGCILKPINLCIVNKSREFS